MNFPVNPAHMALINVDMQNLFVENPKRGGLGLPLLARINALAAVCRDAGILVIHTRNIVRDDGTNTGVLGEIYPAANAAFNQSAHSAALHADLAVDARDIILDKPRYGAFHATDLELILRSKGIDTVVIEGIATNVCCDTTAREAMARDFRVFFLSDGTLASAHSGVSADEIQRATLATLGARFAQVLTMDEMIEKIQNAGQSVAT